MRAIDMTGFETDQYKVVRRATKEEEINSGLKGRHLWLCQCNCGNTFFAQSTWLTKGLKESCGCLRAKHISKASSENLTGKKFGMLTALYLSGQDNCRPERMEM